MKAVEVEATISDIVSNAVEKYLGDGTRVSYQALAREIDSDNLFGINGDEDNPQ